MIQIIPSIAVLNGKVVRLEQGDFSKEIQYESSPLDLAKEFEDHGIKTIQFLDLDGARHGEPKNYHILEVIKGHTNLRVDFTGGIHTDGDINKAFEYGANYITAASVAVINRDLFSSWIMSYGREKVTLGADELNGKVRFEGWQKTAELDIFDHIEYFYNRGLKYVKTTDIARDGVLEGPAFELYAEIMRRFPEVKLIASGGVRTIEDIERLDEMGVSAVIFGRAFYENKITLEDVKELLTRTKV